MYVTGRTLSTSSNASSGTINGVAEEVTAAGGKGVAVACDHSDDDQIRALFTRVNADHGRLAIGANPLAPPLVRHVADFLFSSRAHNPIEYRQIF